MPKNIWQVTENTAPRSQPGGGPVTLWQMPYILGNRTLSITWITPFD